MKTKMMFLKVMLVIPVLILTACGQDKKSKSSVTSGYYMSNGICYASNGSQVPTSYCNNTNSGYYLQNNVCYVTGSNPPQAVNISFCQNTGNTGGTCVGYYFYPYQGQMIPIYCNGADCRGYTVYNQAMQPVYCQ